MNPFVAKRLEEIKAKRYRFDFSITFNRSLAVFQKVLFPAGLAMLLLSLIMGAVLAVYLVGSLDFSDPDAIRQKMDIMQFTPVQLGTYMLVMLLVSGLSMPMAAGMVQLCRDAETGAYFGLGTAFKYYSGPHFSDLFFGGILVGLISVVLNTLLEYSGIPVLGVLISAVLTLFSWLLAPLVIFGDMPPLRAFKASILVVSKEWLMIFLLLLVSYLVALCGLIVFCIGIIFTMPLVYCTQYAVYAESVGFESDTNPTENNIS